MSSGKTRHLSLRFLDWMSILYMCTCICVNICAYVYVYVCVYVCICVSIFMYVTYLMSVVVDNPMFVTPSEPPRRHTSILPLKKRHQPTYSRMDNSINSLTTIEKELAHASTYYHTSTPNTDVDVSPVTTITTVVDVHAVQPTKRLPGRPRKKPAPIHSAATRDSEDFTININGKPKRIITKKARFQIDESASPATLRMADVTDSEFTV